MRAVERQVDAVADVRAALQELIGIIKRILSKKSKDLSKSYALHATESSVWQRNRRVQYGFSVRGVDHVDSQGMLRGGALNTGNNRTVTRWSTRWSRAAILRTLRQRSPLRTRSNNRVTTDRVQVLHPGMRRSMARAVRVAVTSIPVDRARNVRSEQT